MSLTYEEIGLPIARIIDENKGTFKLVYINEDNTSEPETKLSTKFMDEVLSGEEILHLGESLNQGSTLRQFLDSLDEEEPVEEGLGKYLDAPQSMVAVIPKPGSERVLMAGPSGTGKSTQAAKYAAEWKLQNPEGEIILFCVFQRDPAYDGMDLLEIKVNKDILELDTQMDEFANNLVIFDDMDNLPDDERHFVHGLVNNIMANGRKESITVLYLSHVILRGKETKVINNEANKVYLFPGVGDKQNIDFLKGYAGMGTAQARDIANMNSRWLCLNRNRPRYIVHEKGVILL